MGDGVADAAGAGTAASVRDAFAARRPVSAAAREVFSCAISCRAAASCSSRAVASAVAAKADMASSAFSCRAAASASSRAAVPAVAIKTDMARSAFFMRAFPPPTSWGWRAMPMLALM